MNVMQPCLITMQNDELTTVIGNLASLWNQGWEPESEPERPEPHDLAGAILFFLQEPEHLKIGMEPELA